MTLARAERERDAWLDHCYQAVVVDAATAQPELRAWRKATLGGSRYFPESMDDKQYKDGELYRAILDGETVVEFTDMAEIRHQRREQQP